MRSNILIWLVFIPQFLWSQQYIEKEITNWEFKMVGDSIWKPAKVPGTIIDNFIDLSDISNPLHPYYGDNEKLYQRIGEKDWEFRATIHLNKEELRKPIKLIFEQLDAFVKIEVDEEVYYHENAFRPFECEFITTDELVHVKITFFSTVEKTKEIFQEFGSSLPGGERVFSRTPQYQFGWDWGPKFVNMGIRKPVKLRPHSSTLIKDPNLRTKRVGSESELQYDISIETILDSCDIHRTLFLNGVERSSKVYKYEKGVMTDIFCVSTPVELWWPNSTGKGANFYELDIKVTPRGDTNVLAHKHIYYAACDIKLVKEKDKSGESFYFTVNGEKVYAKGANYIPDDSFHPGKNTTELIKLAKEANMNMLRVWGGGTYPDEEFYIECMKNGIMVWQDFMFACSMNPGDVFLNNVALEASYQVERLKDFNNIAVWCGNNENEEGWKNWGWQRELNIHGEDSVKMWNNYEVLFNQILPETIQTANQLYGCHFNYISTSPKHGWGRKESMTDGDSHYWGVWWGLEPLEKYLEKVPRFMSEFGMQGMPDISTLNKVIPDSAMNFDSPEFKNHQKHPTGFKTLDHYLKEYLVIPDKMEDYAYATQILQAYALTIAIEAQRRAMPYCMGSLIWQLNDCWPVTSWSLVDSELKTKISYDLVKKSFAPTIISVKEEKDKYSIYITNDNKKIKNSYMQIQILDFYGKVKFKKNISLTVSENTSKPYFKLSKKIVEQFDATSIYLDLQLFKKEKNKKLTYIYDQQYHFAKLNQLKLPQPDLWVEKDGNNLCWIKSKTYCPYVIIQGEANEPNQFIGTVGPRNTVSHPGPDIDLSRIKCLNTLLKK